VTAKFDDGCVKTYEEKEKGLKRGPHELVFSDKTIPFCAPLAETRFIEYRLKLQKSKVGLLSEARALSPIILNPAFGISPTAEFSADPQSGYAPLTVGFADLSTGTIDTWYWDFDGDAAWDLIEDSPFSSNPFHTYTDPGTYTVKLKVEGSEGADIEEKVAYIVVSERPQPVTAGFKASPKLGPAPLSVQFTDLSVGTISTWQWDFDSNGVIDSTAQNPSHVYNAVGTYTVTLTVSGPGGLDAMTKDQYIRVQ
jgi:PKD repeat protein